MRIALAAPALRPAHPSRCRDRLTWLGQSGSLGCRSIRSSMERRPSEPTAASPSVSHLWAEPAGCTGPHRPFATTKPCKPPGPSKPRHPRRPYPACVRSSLALSRARRRAIFRAFLGSSPSTCDGEGDRFAQRSGGGVAAQRRLHRRPLRQSLRDCHLPIASRWGGSASAARAICPSASAASVTPLRFWRHDGS